MATIPKIILGQDRLQANNSVFVGTGFYVPILPNTIDPPKDQTSAAIGYFDGKLYVWNIGTLLWQEMSGANIGNSDLTLTSDRTLTGDGHFLQIIDVSQFSVNTNGTASIDASSSANITGQTTQIYGRSLLNLITDPGALIEIGNSDAAMQLTFGNTTNSQYATFHAGFGSPEGAHSRQPGSIYIQLDGSGNTMLWLKKSGTGNIGWDKILTRDPETGYVDYNISAGAPTYLEGRVFYEPNTHSLSYYDDISGTSIQIGQETVIRARNNSGVTILNGQVVYISGALGQNPTIALAQANDISKSKVLGIATHDIPNNTIGKITVMGLVNDVNTSAFTDGDKLYLSASTAGGLSATPPSAPNASVFVGYCLFAHGVQGKILVRPDPGPSSLNNFGDGVVDMAGNGSPEGVITASPSSTYRQKDGAAGTLLWVKQTGTGNTGWSPIA